MSKPTSLKALTDLVGGSLTGDPDLPISGVAPLNEAGPGDISWAAGEKYLGDVRSSKAGAVVVPKGFPDPRMPAITVDHPGLAIRAILGHFAPASAHPPAGVNPAASVVEPERLHDSVAVGAHSFIDRGVTVGENTVIYPNVTIGPDCTIGADCILYPGVVIRERCTLGNRVICQPNVSIGGDGFGYEFHEGRHLKIPHIGTVVIEDDVEIGAGSCVDRAKTGQTRVGQGVKIDNLVQVAHNVTVGAGSILVAQVGIAGSTTIGNYVVLGGQVGVRDHVTIGDQVQAGACCCISKDVPPGQVVMGIPAYDAKKFFKDQAQIRKIDRTIRQINELADRVERLESPADH